METEAFWSGWSASAGDYAWQRGVQSIHGESNRWTGPRRGPQDQGKGPYWYAGGRGEDAGGEGTTYILSYDGSLCAGYGVVGWVNFSYHMYRSPQAPASIEMGTLRLRAGGVAWSRSGDQGDVWHRAERVQVASEEFAFEYVRAQGYAEPAIAEIVVECDAAPVPLPPHAPPQPPALPSPPEAPLAASPPPAQGAAPTDGRSFQLAGLWFALALAYVFYWICTHDWFLFGLETPRQHEETLTEKVYASLTV